MDLIKSNARVRDIMSRAVVTLDKDATLADADRVMKESRVDKIVITDDGIPTGVLQDWQTILPPKTNKISSIQVSQVATTHSGAAVQDIRNQLGAVPAVVVYKSPSDKSIAGVVTAADLLKIQKPSSIPSETEANE